MKLVFLAFCVAALASATSGWSDAITPEQAKGAVRAFESNQNLDFSQVTLDRNDAVDAWLQRDEYELTYVDSPSPDRSWTVDASSGEVVWAYYGDAYPSEDSDSNDPFGALSESQCHQIATQFAKLHYSGFGTLNLVADANGHWEGRGWRFSWREVLPSGAGTANGVDVEVNPVSGTIESYSATKVAISNSAVPRLTSGEAVTAAAQAIGIVNVLWNEEPSLSATPTSLLWTVEVGGEDANSKGIRQIVELDAVSGAIVSISGGIEAPHVVSTATASKGKRKLLHVRALVASLPNASVMWLGKAGAKLTVGDQVWMLLPGARAVTLEGKRIPLSDKIVLDNGRLMIPRQLADMVLCFGHTPFRPKARHP